MAYEYITWMLGMGTGTYENQRRPPSEEICIEDFERIDPRVFGEGRRVSLRKFLRLAAGLELSALLQDASCWMSSCLKSNQGARRGRAVRRIKCCLGHQVISLFYSKDLWIKFVPLLFLVLMPFRKNCEIPD